MKKKTEDTNYQYQEQKRICHYRPQRTTLGVKFDSLDEMDQFQRNHKLPKLTQ